MSQYYRCSSLLSLTLALASGAAFAQAGDATTQPAGADALSEIIVTAQRRGQNIQDVPLAVTAFGGDALTKSGVKDVLSLSQVDSSLQTQHKSGAVQPFLRGIGNNAGGTAGNEASVPVYIDDIYYTRLASAYLALANIERVEVLKGPQGTLFGRNASGGLIQIFTRDPSRTEAHLDATLGYGNFDTVSGKLYMSTPLSENAAIDISAVGSRQGDGWGTNFIDGSDAYKNKYYNIRSKLIFDPTETTHIRLSGFYAYQKSSVGLNQGRIYPGGRRGLPPTFTQEFLPPGGIFDIFTNTKTFVRNRGWGVSLKVEQETNLFDLMSITSYRRAREFDPSEGDQTNVNFQAFELNLRDRQITQEFQIRSKQESDINWILGAYYLNSRQGYIPTRVTGDALTANGLLEQRITGIQNVRSYATFGQATFPVVDEKTNITLGLRHTWDNVRGFGVQQRVSAAGVATPPVVGGAVNPFRDSKQFRKLTYKVAVDHKFTDDVLGFVSFSRGYKSGVFNTLPLNAPPTRPEIVQAYEIGIKSELFDRRLRLNASVFQNDIKNPQVQIIGLVSGIAVAQFANAGKARTKGVEFDATLLAATGLQLRLSGQYLNAKYTDFFNAPINFPLSAPPFGIRTCSAVANNCAPGVDTGAPGATGNRLPLAPKWKFNAGVNYDMPTPIGTFNYDVNVAYRSSIHFDPDNFITEPKLTLLNGSVTFTPEFNERISVRGWVSNLTNEKYYIHEAPATGPAGFAGIPAEPRTYGIEVRYRF